YHFALPSRPSPYLAHTCCPVRLSSVGPPPPGSSLFPYTTLFRSLHRSGGLLRHPEKTRGHMRHQGTSFGYRIRFELKRYWLDLLFAVSLFYSLLVLFC